MIEAIIGSSIPVVGIAIVAWLARTWIKERLAADIRLETDSKLEELRSQLARANESLNLITSTGSDALSQAQAALLQHKVEAVRSVWKSVLSWQQATAVTTFAAVLPIEWVEKYGSDPSTKENFERLLKNIDHLKFVQERSDTENERPFLSEEGWALYFAYHSFYTSRLVKASMLIIPGIDHAEIWRRSNERDLIESSAPKEILQEYDENFITGSASYLSYLKEQMLEEFRSYLSGSRESDAAVTNASSILASAERLLASTQSQPSIPDDKPLGNPQ